MKSLRGTGYRDAALGLSIDYSLKEDLDYQYGYFAGERVLREYHRNRKALSCMLITIIVCSGFAAIYTGSKPMCIYSIVISVAFPSALPLYSRFHKKSVIAMANRLR